MTKDNEDSLRTIMDKIDPAVPENMLATFYSLCGEIRTLKAQVKYLIMMLLEKE